MDVLPRSKLNSNKGFQIYIVYDGCSPAQFYREAVMEKSKEEMMEELMAKLKEDLVKGRKQVAAKKKVVVNVVNEVK